MCVAFRPFLQTEVGNRYFLELVKILMEMDYSTKINNPLVYSDILKSGGKEKALLSSRMLASKCRGKMDQKITILQPPV